MNEEKRETLKIWFDLSSKIALIAAGVFAVVRYSDTKTREYQQPLWEAQVRLYFEVSDLAARLTNEFEVDNWERDKIRFYELYWGSMILVEDETVEAAMVGFGNRLYEFDQLSDPEAMHASMTSLREYAHKISYACRDSINHGINRKAPTVRLREDMRN